MKVSHFEILVEEQSMEVFLARILPKIIHEKATFTIHPHQGKPDLLKKLQSRLHAYAAWLPENSRIVVVVDCDSEDCKLLKENLEKAAKAAGLATRTTAAPNRWRYRRA